MTDHNQDDEARAVLLALVIHDLRTPLTVLKVRTQRLERQLRRGRSDREAAAAWAEVDIAVRRLEATIDRLQDGASDCH